MPLLVTSRQNARVRELRAALRGRSPEGTAAIEGWTLLQEALAVESASVTVQTVFLREDRQELAADLPVDLEILVLASDAFSSVAATEQSQGIAVLLHLTPIPFQPAGGDLLVVAAGLQDPGNLGTLIRSAEALGAKAVVLAEQTVNPWNNKAVRASAGSVFRMPLPRWTDQLRKDLCASGIRLLAAVPSGSHAQPATEVDLRGGCAFVIGNEGNGLSPAMLEICDARVTLSMPGPTESLNAAVAGSLLLYEAWRQRSSKPAIPPGTGS